MDYKQVKDKIICVRDTSGIVSYDPAFNVNICFDASIPWEYTEKEIIRLSDNTLEFTDSPNANAFKDMKAQKKAEIAAARYAAETGGCTVDGVTIATDRGSQALLTAAVVTARLDPEFKTRWKCADGHFVTLNAMQLRAIGDAVTAHVEACFAREAELVELIDAAQTADDLAAISWPENLGG